LKTHVEKQFKILSKKYKITNKDKELFMKSVNFRLPFRKKTILSYEQRCKSRKQDGTQCSRRHKPDESFCGKHIYNQTYGIYQLTETSTATSVASDASVDLQEKSEQSVKSVTNSKAKRGRKPKKDNDAHEFLTLKSVQIKNGYYYIDKFNILYNPEPINGQYEIIGKLKDDMSDEIYYATTLS
jgi:hypothetical protein